MKRWVGAAAVVGAVALLAGTSFAQMGWGYGPGMMGPGMMGPGMGPGMMGQGWQGGGYGCPGMGGYGQGQAPASQIDPARAKEISQTYADQYLQGFTVDKVLPFTGMGGMTMYSVELKGPKDEVRGNVMPFGGPWRRAG